MKKKLVGILLAVSIIFSSNTTCYAGKQMLMVTGIKMMMAQAQRTHGS